MKQSVLIEKFIERKCAKCKNIYPATLDFFHKDKSQFLSLRYDCKTCSTERSKKYNNKHKEQKSEYNKTYREINQETELLRKKEWYYNNKDSSNKLSVKNKKIKRHTDSFYKMTVNIRNLIKMSLKRQNVSKRNKTHEILGCTYKEFKEHIEELFLPWMNWENYGKYNGKLNFGWDFDHIIPISSALNEKDIIKLNHYTNYQPLCSHINRDIKQNKIDFILKFEAN